MGFLIHGPTIYSYAFMHNQPGAAIKVKLWNGRGTVNNTHQDHLDGAKKGIIRYFKITFLKFMKEPGI